MATSTKTETDLRPATIFRQILLQEYEAKDLGKLHDIRFEFQATCNGYNAHNIYPACSCAFHHEFVDYMDGNRIIDVDIFNQICMAIENGKCAHALSAASNDIGTTSVSAYHVAIAVGYKSVLKHVPIKPTYRNSRIYSLNDFHIAMLKGHYGYLDESTNSKETGSTSDGDFSRLFDTFTLVEKDPTCTALKMGSNMTLLRFFAKAGNMQMFQRLLVHSWLGDKCEKECSYFVIEDDYIALEALLAHMSNYSNSSGVKKSLTDDVAGTIVAAAVFKDSDRSLRMLEKFVLETNNFEKSEEWTFLAAGPFYLDIAIKLGHDACAEILHQHIHTNKDNDPELLSCLLDLRVITSHSTSSLKVHNLVQYLCRKVVTLGLIDEVGTILRNYRGKPTRLDIYGTYCTRTMIDKLFTQYPCASRSIFRSGRSCIRKFTNNALMRALTIEGGCGVDPIEECIFFDDLLRFIMVHNPDLSQINIEQMMRPAITNDVSKHTLKFGIRSQTSNFQHVGMILFTIPLLWECGLVFSMNDLIKDKNFDSLPECVRTFLAHAHSKPRSLKLQCRDRIRRHHIGLRLHEWVKTIICPDALKRYILIEDALAMTDKTECLCQSLKKFVPIT